MTRKINREYYYWDKVKYLPRPDSITAEELWALVKYIRRSNSTYYEIISISPMLGVYLTSTIHQYLHEFDRNIGWDLGSSGIIPEVDKQYYLTNSIMEEAIASSQMEGAATTRKVAKEMLRKNQRPRSRDEQMIYNNYSTIRHLLANKDMPLTKERILEIHRLITFKTLDNPEEEGKFRDSDDIYVVDHTTSEAVHIPPHTQIEDAMSELCAIFNDEGGDFIHPIIKGIIIHFMIGYIHPFCDGNGRTARTLFYWYMIKKGYWWIEYLSISRIIARSKAQYERAYLYTENDGNDLTYFVLYNLRAMDKAYTALRNYIQHRMRSRRDITRFLRIPAINQRQAEILCLFQENSNFYMTVKEMMNRFGITHPTAKSDLQKLVDKGFLKKIQVNGKQVNYFRSEDFEEMLDSL